uniref:FBA_2 domain-containing protein n=2 Tax=Caenorhabditis tropicalis TaxID=1561998 RepID=A0A1I7UU30_9PELO
MKNNEVHAQFYSNLYKDQKNTDLIMKVSKEPLKDVIKWYDYAREVLNCKIKSLFFRLHSSSSEHRQTIDWIAAQNKTMKFTSVLNEIEELDDDLKYFMETIQILEGFYLMVNKHKDDFRIEIPGKPKCLHIGNAQFIDYNQLLRLKSPVIVLQKSILTNEEINRFLRSWMSCETHLDLEALQINILGPNAMNEIMDLPHEKTNALNLVQAFYDYHMIRQVINEMFTLKRCNGKKRATVTTGRSGDDWTLYLVVH